MHHALRFYSTNQELAVRFYMFGARFTRLPLAGKYVKDLLNKYALTQHAAYVLTPNDVGKIICAATSIAVGDCKCRKVFKNCDRELRADIVFGVGFDVFTEVREDEYVEIDRNGARDIIDRCRESGLIQVLLKCRDDFYAICNCCSCCCVPVRLRSEYGIESVLVRDAGAVERML